MFSAACTKTEASNVVTFFANCFLSCLKKNWRTISSDTHIPYIRSSESDLTVKTAKQLNEFYDIQQITTIVVQYAKTFDRESIENYFLATDETWDEKSHGSTKSSHAMELHEWSETSAYHDLSANIPSLPPTLARIGFCIQFHRSKNCRSKPEPQRPYDGR